MRSWDELYYVQFFLSGFLSPPPLQYPGAFNMTTGPAHWEALARSRALDNQVYVATVSPARDTSASYVAWGHSTVMDPWGSVVSKTEEKEDYLNQ